MPQISDTVSVPANGVVANAFQGSPFERLAARPANLRLYAVAVGGASNGLIRGDFSTGSQMIFRNTGLKLVATGAIIPDHQIGSGRGLPFDAISFKLTNTTGAAISVDFILDIEEM